MKPAAEIASPLVSFPDLGQNCDMRLTAGTRLGPYEIQDALGKGGMGEVYRARDTRLQRDVAIKILPENFADTTEATKRFEREAKALAALSHPNILTVFDVGTEQGIAYVVTELLKGQNLAEHDLCRRFQLAKSGRNRHSDC